MIAGLPAAHKECHYRCFLPDLAEFVILCCADPAIKPKSIMAERGRFELPVLAYTRVPGVHLKPLGHLSVIGYPDENVSHYVYCRDSFGNEKLGFHLKKTDRNRIHD